MPTDSKGDTHEKSSLVPISKTISFLVPKEKILIVVAIFCVTCLCSTIYLQWRGQQGVSSLLVEHGKIAEEIKDLRKLLASANAVSSETNEMPLLLKQFLEDIRCSAGLMAKDSSEIAKLRKDLVDAINQMDGARRDNLRDEITLANWGLEALDSLAHRTYDSIQDRMAAFVVLKSLRDADPVQINDELKLAVNQQFEELKKQLMSDLDPLMEPVYQLKLETPENDVNTVVLIYDLLADAGVAVSEKDTDACRAFLSMQDWFKKVKKLPSSIGVEENESLRIRSMLILKNEGEVLRDDCFGLGISEPAEFQQTLQELSVAAEELQDKKYRSQSSAYQLWAIERIEMAQQFGVGDVRGKVSAFLKESNSDPAAAAAKPLHLTLLKEFPSFREKIGQLTGLSALNAKDEPNVDGNLVYNISKALHQTIGWRGIEELERCLVADVISQNLLPIDENLLDRAVSSLYAEVFDQCWRHDAALPNRVELAKVAANTTKVKPEQIKKRK